MTEIPFGGWVPVLAGIIPTAPPPRLNEKAAAFFEFSYEQLKVYRLQSQPYIVRVHYDLVQKMLEDRISKNEERRFGDWLDWVGRNL